MRTKTLMTVFYMSWLVCGCSVEKMLDDWRAGWTFIIALIVAILCIVVMAKREGE